MKSITFKLLGDTQNTNNDIWIECPGSDPYVDTPAEYFLSYIMNEGYEPYGPWDFTPSAECFNELVAGGLDNIVLVTDNGDGLPLRVDVKVQH